MRDWRSPEELADIGFSRSPVVMANEAHDGLRRCIRTREIGRRLLPVAHGHGCRHLAMEALWEEIAEQANRDRRLPDSSGYLGQPEMRALVEDALALGWTLVAYETTDTRTPFLPDGSVDQAIVNAREVDQARNLAARLPQTPLLVWCGNGHLEKESGGDWTPMGMLFRELTGIDFFALDQTWTVFGQRELGTELTADLEPFGGTAGMLREELPAAFATWSADALLFSVENALV